MSTKKTTTKPTVKPTPPPNRYVRENSFGNPKLPKMPPKKGK